MANQEYMYEKSKQQPVDSGIENAKEKIEKSPSGGFKVSDIDFSHLRRILREIWEEKKQAEQIPEEFASTLFELIALAQFQRIKSDNVSWDRVELENLFETIRTIIKRW